MKTIRAERSRFQPAAPLHVHKSPPQPDQLADDQAGELTLLVRWCNARRERDHRRAVMLRRELRQRHRISIVALDDGPRPGGGA